MSTVKANVNGEAAREGVRDEKAQTAGKATTTNEELGGAGNIDKIRDILFGVQMRDYEKRFARREQRLMKEESDLRDETRKRFDSLEQYIKEEMEALVERVTTEQNASSEA